MRTTTTISHYVKNVTVLSSSKFVTRNLLIIVLLSLFLLLAVQTANASDYVSLEPLINNDGWTLDQHVTINNGMTANADAADNHFATKALPSPILAGSKWRYDFDLTTPSAGTYTVYVGLGGSTTDTNKWTAFTIGADKTIGISNNGNWEPIVTAANTALNHKYHFQIASDGINVTYSMKNTSGDMLLYKYAAPTYNLTHYCVKFSVGTGTANGLTINNMAAANTWTGYSNASFNAPMYIVNTPNNDGVISLIVAPPNYTASTPCRMVLSSHAYSYYYQASVQATVLMNVTNALLNDNYIFCISNTHGDNWGNNQSITDNRALVDYVKNNFNVQNKIYMYGYSMGGIQNLNFALRYPTEIAAIAGSAPVTTLDYMYPNANIDTAYSCNSGTFAAATYENNPFKHFAVLKDIPFKAWAGTNDGTVPYKSSTEYAANITALGGVASVVTITGGNHGSIEIFDGPKVAEFFDQYPLAETPAFTLSASTTTVTESDTTIILTITKNDTTVGVFNVTIATADSTATAPNDYTAINQVLSFAPNDLTKTATLSIKENKLNREPKISFNVALSNPTGNATLGTPSSLVITIVNVNRANDIMGGQNYVPRITAVVGLFFILPILAIVTVIILMLVTRNVNPYVLVSLFILLGLFIIIAVVMLAISGDVITMLW
jgi:hypothetical protein